MLLTPKKMQILHFSPRLGGVSASFALVAISFIYLVLAGNRMPFFNLPAARSAKILSHFHQPFL
jgi:hypothetical protein